MKFAAFTTVAGSAGEARSAEEHIDNLRRQTILAEELGFEAMWLGEHHFGPYGVGDLPNPILLGADLAARTSRIRIGQMANIAPWWHPIRLAEDLAMLDNMSGGRVEVGFGRGIWPYEGPQFHPNADPRRDRENRVLFQETVEIVREIWTNEYFSHQGENYTFPVDDTIFSQSKVSIEPRLAGRGQGDEAAGDAQAPAGAAPSAVDDRLHRPLRHDRRRAWAEGLLLAAPGSQDQAANGALRPGQERDGGKAVRPGRGPGRHALDVCRSFDGGSAPGCGRRHHVGVHLQ